MMLFVKVVMEYEPLVVSLASLTVSATCFTGEKGNLAVFLFWRTL